MELPILYKRASTGKIQQWQVFIQDGTYWTVAGQVGGKLTTSKPTQCKGKNLTKSNATTPQTQAEADAKSKWQGKLDSGYTENVDDVDTVSDGRIEVMLAETWEDAQASPKHAVVYPVISQPKLDGIRCIVTRDEMMSRKWKPIVACPHIRESLQQLFKDHPDLVALDGELYNHKFHAEFHEIMSLVRKTKPEPEDLAQSAALIEYHVYDVILNREQTNAQRNFWLEMNVKDQFTGVEVVPSKVIDDLVQLDAEYDRLMALNYEGQMVRRAISPYIHKRSFNLLKRKEFVDAEFLIVGWEECEGNRAGTFSFRCAWGDKPYDPDDKTTYFVAPLNGTVKYLQSLWPLRDSFVGQYCTVQYFPPPIGCKPRFPRCKSIRPMENGQPTL